MNKKPIIIFAILALSLAALFVFKANWGIDFADANLYIVSTDNAALTDNILTDSSKLPSLARVEQVGEGSLYLYFQPLSDNVDTAVGEFAAKYDLSMTDSMIYRYSSEEFRLIVNRATTLGMIILFVLFFYQGVELRSKGWKRWQVGYYIVTDFLVTAGVSLIVCAIASVMGQLSLKMDNDFVVMMGLALGIGILYRLYEVELIKRISINEKNITNYAEIKSIFKTRKPELILLSCVLLLAGFMPLVVLSWPLAAMSILIGASIGLSYLSSVYIKPGLTVFMLKQGEETGFLKKKAFSKLW